MLPAKAALNSLTISRISVGSRAYERTVGVKELGFGLSEGEDVDPGYT
jgi:hypothetical protein